MGVRCCSFWILLVGSACGDNLSLPPDSPRVDAAMALVDSPRPDAMPDAAPLVRVQGNVDYNGPLAGVSVTTLGPSPQTTMTDAAGDFFFDAPDGSRLVFKATPMASLGLLPMIRGVVARDDLRPRVFYMLSQSELSNASQLGVTFDPTEAIIEVDFRNAAIAGYGATLSSGGASIQPEFGIAYDDNGDPQLSLLTVAGGNGSTLLLAGLPAGDVSFAPSVPAGATLPCQPRDANPLPVQAGTVTWYDYECGNATD